MVYSDKLPPHDMDAEEAVLGSVIIDGARMADVEGVLRADAFYRELNRDVFAACENLYKRGEPIDEVTVASEMARLPLERQNRAYLAHLAYVVPTSLHAAHYARKVADAAQKRSLIDAAGDIAALAYADEVPADAAVSQAEALLYKLHAPRRGGLRAVRDTLDAYLEEQSVQLDDVLVHRAPLPTGFADLDAALGRLRRGALYVIASRPSVGKSALAANIARNAASQGARVGYFSMEMSDNELVTRLLSAEAEVDSHMLHLGLLSEVATDRVYGAVGSLSDLPLFIDDTHQQTVLGIRGECERVRALGDEIDLVIIDYLQLMDQDGRRRGNRVEDVSEITRGLKRLASELDVPVIALSQLSRAIEQRPDHYPMLSDLRESGSIEQDADVVVFIHREDRYFTEEQWAARHPTEPYPANLTQLIVAKNRHGPTNVVHLFARMQFGRFETLARDYESVPARLPYAEEG